MKAIDFWKRIREDIELYKPADDIRPEEEDSEDARENVIDFIGRLEVAIGDWYNE